MTSIACPRCGEMFERNAKGARRKFCRSCSPGRDDRVTRRLGKDCLTCGNYFLGSPRQTYCTHECRTTRIKVEREARRAEALLKTSKHCSRCEKDLPFTEFRKDRGRVDGHYPWCRDCYRDYQGNKMRQPSKWSSKSEYNRQYRVANQPRIQSEYTDRYLWTTYRLTAHGFNEMLKRQAGRCAICQTDKPGSKGFHVDHDHSCCTGSRSCGDCVRGLLCFPCNIGIGLLRDNPATLRSALRYLDSPPHQPTQTQLSDDDEWTLKLA